MATQHTPQERAALTAAFNAWVRRTHTRFAPHMGAVDDAFVEWQRCYPKEVAAALASCQPQPAQFLGMSDDAEPMARYFIPGGL